ncbi:hypothetical protein N658DRAFT_556519 [Parathielavia hyrcaniae]|uniref:Nephrocystin 3-like N-terminal domain-containing protein n=1 Tax=Parathielavia hyrcaniae TaxID=113614 RepID=A0AAN6T4P5_9PEZI|nr:hypothetical protein N658DRAFT_556519 [Parathielavia hyrcaniae]
MSHSLDERLEQLVLKHIVSSEIKPYTPKSPPDPSFPDGVKGLHDCPDATVDVCFIHGLAGDRESTWTAEGQSAPWIKTLLPFKLDRARILTYGYNAKVVRRSVASSNRLIDYATDLLTDLTADSARCIAPTRPIIFVAHGLGGLVCKQAILLSRNNPDSHLQGIFHCTIAIAFMGTPRKGSWMADWARIPASALGFVESVNKSLLAVLQTNSEALELIQVSFWSMIRERQKANQPPEVACFFEQLLLPGFGTVVSKESATLEAYSAISIHANHREMVRFASAEDNGFRRLLEELVRWKSQVGQILSETAYDCLKLLAFPQMQDRSHDIGSALDGTCSWLLEHTEYKGWAASDRGLLGIKGKPGSGKSTLLKHAVDNHGARDGALVLSFFFHGRGDELQRTPLGLFRSILHQLLGQAPAALQNLVDSFGRKVKENGKPGQDWHWREGGLRAFLDSSLPKIANTRPVWLFVDALDECGKENAVGLVKLFKRLLKRVDSQDTKLCAGFPFLRYATTSWLEHVKHCDAGTSLMMSFWICLVDHLILSWKYGCGSTGPFTRMILRLFEELIWYTWWRIMVYWGYYGPYACGTPLLWAAAAGHEAIVKLLLSTGRVDVDSRGISDFTSLWWAAEIGHEGICKLLLRTGNVDVDSRNDNGMTALSRAALFKRTAVVQLLLDTGKADINPEDCNGDTTVVSRQTADVNTKDADGRTPLSLAAIQGHLPNAAARTLSNYCSILVKSTSIRRMPMAEHRCFGPLFTATRPLCGYLSRRK